MIQNTGFVGEHRDALADLIKSKAVQQFNEAKQWFSRISKERAEEVLLNKIVENLSQNLSDGILQLTVESISKTSQYEDAITHDRRDVVLDLREKLPLTKLPAFEPYVEFVPRIGSIELTSKRFRFRAVASIELHGVRVTIVDKRIDGVSINTLTASIDLSIVNGVDISLGTIRRTMKINDNSIVQEIDEIGESRKTQPSSSAEGIVPPRKFCVECGASIRASANFCSKCDAKQPQ